MLESRCTRSDRIIGVIITQGEDDSIELALCRVLILVWPSAISTRAEGPSADSTRSDQNQLEALCEFYAIIRLLGDDTMLTHQITW